MEWNTELPEKDGKYIVKTESFYGPGNFHRSEGVLQATLHTNDKGHKSWNFKNQFFVAYLK